MMRGTICQLVYCSRNCIPAEGEAADAEIDRILEVSRRNNGHDAVTGALIFGPGSFAQVLEGPLEAVERTFERIQCDPRHADVVVLHVRHADRRDFADWSMAYAGRLRVASADAGALSRALDTAGAEGAEAVLGMLRGLVRREAEWAGAA